MESSYVELPRSQRIALAHQAWKDANGELSMKKIARIYGISSSTLQGRIKGAVPKERASQAMQKLSKDEEDALTEWINLLSDLGWPARTDYLREMARELLRARGDSSDLGVHWHDGFLQRHPDLKTNFVRRMDAERTRAKSQEVGTVRAWFELYQDTIAKYNIHRDDIYNMDERSVMIGAMGKNEIVISRHERRRQNNLKVPPNHQWVSLIECVATTGKSFPPWFVFKGQQQMQAWQNILRGTDGRISMSDHGWSNNELNLDWLKQHFERHSTPLYGDGGYRLLILDGHALYITTQAIQFCITSKIILICMPPYSTQLLQPLDVGVFPLLTSAYEQNIRDQSQYVANYYVDVGEFLKTYLNSRMHTMTIQNVQNAWEDTGLEPLNVELVLSRLSALIEQSSASNGAAAYPSEEENAFQIPRQMPKLVNGILGMKKNDITVAENVLLKRRSLRILNIRYIEENRGAGRWSNDVKKTHHTLEELYMDQCE